MVPLITGLASAAHYNDVFHNPALDDWRSIPLAIGAALGVVSLVALVSFGRFLSDKAFSIVLGTVFLFGLVIMPICLLVAQASNRPTIQTMMNDNLKQKYGAALDEHSNIPSKLTEPNPYELILSDGTKATYSLRWDKDTSEPIIINAPTLQPHS